MNRKALIVVLFIVVLFSLNFSVAHEMDNSTSNEVFVASDEAVSSTVDSNQNILNASSAVKTQINVESNTTFDVVGDYFKVKLSDVNGNALKNTKLTFAISGTTYVRNTDSNGIASLQLRLNDGTYKITTKFAGNSNYKSSSLTTAIKMTNTKVVDVGLSNSEIQNIIDNAKINNIILFKGLSYSNINLLITKSLTLISNVNTVLKSGSGPTITIKGKNASLTTINGFNIQSGGDGIVVTGADYVKIIDNDISGKGNGIVSIGTKYLNVTKNSIVKNSKSGIVIADSGSTYVFNNKISNNGLDGVGISKSNKVYIHGNIISGNDRHGVYVDKTVNGVNYGEGPKNIYINKNTIENNKQDGILIQNAGDNINIKSNSIESNKGNGISIAHIGDNSIQSNVITDNYQNGIKFFDSYIKPKNQVISYNAIYFNTHMDVEAKDTYYQDTGNRLEIGDNWYTDFAGICPKIRSNNIKFVVTQVGANKFQASFLDSNGNIASLLPDRTLKYKTNNGQTLSITIKGGTGVFTVNGRDGDIVKATVDYSQRNNAYDSKTKDVPSSNGQSPSYVYPSIPDYQIYEDIGNGGGNGNGNGNGEGSSGNANKSNGSFTQVNSDNTVNSTQSQQSSPSSNANNQVNDVSQSYDTSETTSQESASEASAGNSGSPGSQSQSVVKQIVLDEEDIYRVTGTALIILLIILTICFYYRDDIKEMNSKR
ncbi:nitrous oxide reductase family maturation protein NosD [uncultured Methanobrevibacter sp.]|uniref:right-handed parallel beta-helix repeat-containing protein n=1 Tax=uncultured Methanobrevibacter sp. TaxID=253161 RepID=UPI0025EAC293|nr:right-handed parallel beta-helix repeat-containing protein [uncultured Methanobrevibacter sp.]